MGTLPRYREGEPWLEARLAAELRAIERKRRLAHRRIWLKALRDVSVVVVASAAFWYFVAVQAPGP